MTRFVFVSVPMLTFVFDLFEMEIYGPVNAIKVMSSRSVNLSTLFLGRLSLLSG